MANPQEALAGELLLQEPDVSRSPTSDAATPASKELSRLGEGQVDHELPTCQTPPPLMITPHHMDQQPLFNGKQLGNMERGEQLQHYGHQLVGSPSASHSSSDSVGRASVYSNSELRPPPRSRTSDPDLQLQAQAISIQTASVRHVTICVPTPLVTTRVQTAGISPPQIPQHRLEVDTYTRYSIFDHTLPPAYNELHPDQPLNIRNILPLRNGTQRRVGTKKTLKLTANGHFVQDLDVPQPCLRFGKLGDGEEFTKLRYTAATCDANDFFQNGYTLRQREWGRKTELFVVVTLYNEDESSFAKTMDSIATNVAHLCHQDTSFTWGADAWQKVVVCIVADGRNKIHPNVLSTLGIMGCYQDQVMKESVNGKATTAHIFEYTSQVIIDQQGTFKSHQDGYVPLQILLCIKERNAKKINSHRWFFNGFGPVIEPEVCITLDVGTKPHATSFWHLYHAFVRDANLGGACGEIYAETGRFGSKLLNPLVAAQNFEYKMTNILDKPLESVFGYVSVLPGAFSAYRYHALQDEPLRKYFIGEGRAGEASGTVFTANMYLAEDRILCFELLTKRNCSWKLKYIRDAKAETDVPSGVPEFISQRRRWLNGAFFAMLHSIVNWWALWQSGHNFFRKIGLTFLMLYNFVNVCFNWFAIGNFYLYFYFVYLGSVETNVDADPFGGYGDYVFGVVRETYLLALLMIFVASMGNRPQGAKVLYTICMVVFGLLFISILYVTIWLLWPATANAAIVMPDITNAVSDYSPWKDFLFSLTTTFGVYIIASVLYFDAWHILTSSLQYMLLLPSYVNILQIHGFANIHDVSWGTKGDGYESTGLTAVEAKKGTNEVEVEVVTEKDDLEANYEAFLLDLRNSPLDMAKKVEEASAQSDYYRSYRTNLLLSWIFTNFLLVVLMTTPECNTFILSKLGIVRTTNFNPYLSFIFLGVAVLLAIRFVGAMLYLLLAKLRGC
ncbi:chitin synthase [Synchytrium endobioticum]|uniref:Chitin synthase n=1 Tax=Synchytrium endobioticum TaxID=286115 RepID=A0A507DCH5_9FUNG|nr:chitin synthase [Synchytrium endobioticum]TPX49294.1 chitin synthase [Synchytrium endobioticum]